MLGLDIYFFLGNFSFCVCQLKGKRMCHIGIDQKPGGCLYIIREIKGWINFILIWGQQNRVTEKQHACLSAIQIKANARLHLGAAELAGPRSSNASLVTEAGCGTGTHTKEGPTPTPHCTFNEGSRCLPVMRSVSYATSTPGKKAQRAWAVALRKPAQSCWK